MVDTEVVARDKRGVHGRGDRARGVGGIRTALLLVFLLPGLACRIWDNPLDPVGNQPPAVPRSPSPADSSIQTDLDLVLSWQSYDPDRGDTLHFDIFMGTTSPPGLVQSGWRHTTFQPTDVADSTRYYWRVTAYDNHGDSTVGPLWQFQTYAALAVTAPDAGEQLPMHSQDPVTWTGGPPGTADSTVLSLSVNEGAAWTRLGKTASAGRFAWEVPAPATESAKVKGKVCALTDTMTGRGGRFEIPVAITDSRVPDRQD